MRKMRRQLWCMLLLSSLSALILVAQATIAIRGTVTDPSGAVVPRATISILRGDAIVASTTTGTEGEYRLAIAAQPGDTIRVTAAGFRSFTRSLRSLPREAVVDWQLELESLGQQITVTATGTPTPEGQLGAAVSVLNKEDYAGEEDMQQALRLIPGVQVTQTGQPGGQTSLYIRGGASDANKVLIDGIPINDIGGAVNFANLATAGVGSAEVLRGPNSVLYGPDAMAGVISLNTAHGSTPLPLLTYGIDGGNFNTYRQEGTLGGVHRQLDYFSEFARFDTGNSIPDNRFHNGTFAGSFGWKPSKAANVRATVHHDQGASGQPDAILLYGIPSLAKQANEDSYFGVTFENQASETWHNLVRYGGVRLRSLYTDFSPTGIPQLDDSGDVLDYLGAPVTIRGANGYTATGQALYQYVEEYPNTYPTSTDEDFVYAQTDKLIGQHMIGLFGFQYENERGYSGSPEGSIRRGNYNYTLQLQGDIRNRLFYAVGGGLEDNGLFGFAGVPRVSLAYAFRRPSGGGVGGTKLRASFGEGIKEPNLSDQTTSLFALLASLENGEQLISQYHVAQVGAENSRTYDIGIDQEFLDGRAQAGLTLFHNEFTHGIEFIPQQGLIALGVPAPIAIAAVDGATVNSQAYRAEGAELELQYQASRSIFLRGGYTYLDTRVQQSFSSDAIGPSFNPNFPGVPIGAYTPLVGARPFRLAPHTGYFEAGYSHTRFSGTLTGRLVSRRDDSDFLASDANGELTLLLPNRNLDPAYERLDAFVSYRANRHLQLQSSFQNLLSQHYVEAFGYPASPFTFRSGVRFSFGGESWSLR